MPLKSAVRRWCWTDGPERMNPQECFSDERLCWGTLGEVGSSRLQVAWKYGLPLQAEIVVTTSPMVSVKWTLIAMLPEGLLFARKTHDRTWIWATPFICRPQVLQVEVRPNELLFSRLSGVQAACMPVAEGTINWMQVQDFLMETLNFKSEFHFKLLVGNRVVGPRNMKTLVHLPLMDEDAVPMPAPVPLTPAENWTLRQKAPRRYREEFLHHELKTSDEESDEARLLTPAAAGSDAVDADGPAAAAPSSSSSTTDPDATLLLGDTPPSRRVTKKRTHHNMD